MPDSIPTGQFFDLQVNGFAGVDFQQPTLTQAELEHAAQALRAHRTGRILLTLITDRVDALCAQLERIAGKGNFAGSSLTMDRAAANVERFLGWTQAEAMAACSARVAAYLGLPE